MAIIKEKFEELAICLCPITGAACLIVAPFIIVKLMIAVMAMSFALPLHLFKALRISKNGKLKRIQFKSYQIAAITSIPI